MKRVLITQPMIGICFMQVCAVSDATDEEILEIANRENPAGTERGWTQVAREDYKDSRMRPVDCEDNKLLNDEDHQRKHFILIC